MSLIRNPRKLVRPGQWVLAKIDPTCWVKTHSYDFSGAERQAGQVGYWQYGQAQKSPDLAISDLSRFSHPASPAQKSPDLAISDLSPLPLLPYYLPLLLSDPLCHFSRLSLFSRQRRHHGRCADAPSSRMIGRPVLAVTRGLDAGV